jgi:hypothetical protein
MSAPRPHSTTDLALAPVLIGIERNLARLREATDLKFELALELNDDDRWYCTAPERARRVQEFALRDVDVHGWTVRPTADLYGLAASHNGYTVSLALGKRLTEYVAYGMDFATTEWVGPAGCYSPSGIDS